MTEQDLHISKRLKEVLPPLTKEEKEQLKANIEADGRVTDVILYWHDGKRNVVVDGMNRFELVRGNGIPFRTEPVEIEGGYEAVELWILNRQLGRRNLLSPAAIRKTRGELYNRLKRDDGGHGDQKSGGKNCTPIANAAEEVAEKAGVSERTVKNDGKFAEAIGKIPKALRTAIETGKVKATDAEVKALAAAELEKQQAVARDLRVGKASTLKEAMKSHQVRQKPRKDTGAAVESPKQKPALERKLDRPAYYKEWDRAIGPLVRLVDRIARGVGETGCQSHKVIQDQLQATTEEMAEWMGVELP